MRRLTTIGGALTLLALSGCGGSSGSGSCATPDSHAVFELGTGEACFERLTSGQIVPQIAGPQGGFHVWAAIGCGDCGADTIVEFGTKHAKTKAWLQGVPEKQKVDLGTGDWGQHAGLTAFLPGDSMLALDEKLPEGANIILSLRALDPKGKELHAAEISLVLGKLEQWSGCSSADTCGTSGFEPCCAN
jgi:hypothetical protein